MRPPPVAKSHGWTVACLLFALVVSLQAACVQSVALAANVVLRAVELPWGDEVLFECPSDWPTTIVIPDDAPPMPTIEMKPDKDSLVLVSIFPYAILGERLTDEEIRDEVYEAGTGWLPRAVESELILYELSGEHVSGYYYSLTDSAPVPDDPDDYDYLYQGMADIGYALMLFSVFSDIKDSEAVNQALAALRSIQYINRKDVKSLET